MGAVTAPPMADTILNALSSAKAGNPMELHRLQHAFHQQPKDDTIAKLLTALTYVTSHLHSAPETAHPLRTLIDAVLTIDLRTFVTPAQQPSSSPSSSPASAALSAFTLFALNLVSVDAAFVEPVLSLLVTRVFVKPMEHGGALQAAVVKIVTCILRTHGRADVLLADAVWNSYPHPVRPEEDHVSYLTAALSVTRLVNMPLLTNSITMAVVDRMAAIEAMVSTSSSAAATSPSSLPLSEAADAATALAERPAAAKLQAIVLAFMRHLDAAYADSPEVYATCHLEAVCASYEALVVPVAYTPVLPYVLLYAASLGGGKAVPVVCERLRQAFFDLGVSPRLRGLFLTQSAVMVMRSKLFSAHRAQRWVSKLARWLNAYVDATDRWGNLGIESEDVCMNNYDGGSGGRRGVSVDVAVHHLFYTACAILMAIFKHRHDLFDGSRGSEVLAKWRLSRILRSALNPLQVLPSALVSSFMDSVRVHAECDLAGIVRESAGRFVPCRTRFGTPNCVTGVYECPDLDLPEVRSAVDRFVQWNVKLANGTDVVMSDTPGVRLRTIEKSQQTLPSPPEILLA